jgi:hypothetical protein
VNVCMPRRRCARRLPPPRRRRVCVSSRVLRSGLSCALGVQAHPAGQEVPLPIVCEGCDRLVCGAGWLVSAACLSIVGCPVTLKLPCRVSRLQVAAKYAPMTCTIVGVDLVPIRPIPNVITHAEDITGGRVRQLLQKDLNSQKADVVLHDGAPNVGANWAKDAYGQVRTIAATPRDCVPVWRRTEDACLRVTRAVRAHALRAQARCRVPASRRHFRDKGEEPSVSLQRERSRRCCVRVRQWCIGVACCVSAAGVPISGLQLPAVGVQPAV